MAANEEGDETAPRGNEWEVVTLTASAYAAAPGPEQVDLNHDSQGKLGGQNVAEASNTMFMSSHFVFPPSQHENLPLEPELSVKNDVSDVKGGEFDVHQLAAEERGKSDVKDDNNASIKDLMSDKFPEVLMFDEKGNTVLGSSADFQKDVIFDKEKSVSSSTEFQSSHFEATDDTPFPQDSSSDSRFLNFQKPSDLPCEAWWKRRVVPLYCQAKEASSFWSIFITAAVMGLVIIGHQWQQERRQVLHLKWHSGVSDR